MRCLQSQGVARRAGLAVLHRCSTYTQELAVLHREQLVDARDKSRGFRHELRIRLILTKTCPSAFPFQPLINATGDLRTCVQCFKMATKMLRCAGCKWARYCDRVCQKADWRTHRTECCPDHSLPKYQRSIPYQSWVYESCLNISRRVAILTQRGTMFIHRRAGEERCIRCISAEDERSAAMTMVVSALTVSSAISAPSSSSGSLNTADNAAFRKEFFAPISRHEVTHTIDQLLARYPPSDTVEGVPTDFR